MFTWLCCFAYGVGFYCGGVWLVCGFVAVVLLFTLWFVNSVGIMCYEFWWFSLFLVNLNLRLLGWFEECLLGLVDGVFWLLADCVSSV